MKSRFLSPMAVGRIAFSHQLLSISAVLQVAHEHRRWMTPSKAAEPGEASSPGVSRKTFAPASGSPVEDNAPPRPRVTPPLSLGRFAPARLKIAYRGFIHLRVASR